MRRYQLESFVRVHKLTPARRAIVLERMKRRLDELTAPEFARVRGLVGEALKLQREALVLSQARRTSQEDAMHADGARALDAKLDKLLSLLHGTLQGMAEIFDGAEAHQARKVREAVFPDGVAPITKRPFVEQHELVKWLIRELRQGDLSVAIASLGLGAWVERLDEINAAYGQHITRPDRVDPERVRAADTRAWLALVEVVAGVLALYPTHSESDQAGRQHLLQPLVEQQQEAALLRTRRRQGVSGEEELPAEDTLEPEEDAEDVALTG